MAASDHLNQNQLGDPSSVPPEFGSSPIPHGTVRIGHYTSAENVDNIRRDGLRQSAAQASYDRGGTEAPIIFATAGKANDNLLRSAPVIEAYADPARGKQLDIGENWRDEDPGQYAHDIEARNSTVTVRGDLPANQIVAAHEPWHSSYRYLQRNPDMESGIMAGDYDWGGDPDTEKAVNTTKIPLAAKVMLGGKLGGEPFDKR